MGGDCLIDYLQQEDRIAFSFMDLEWIFCTHSFLPVGTEEHTMYSPSGDIYLNPIH